VVPVVVPTPTVSMCTPAFSATAAAALVAASMPVLPAVPPSFWPSESSTMVAEGQKPMFGALPLRPMATVLCVIADSEARMASPSDVPPAAFSRRTAAEAVA
jgi:hypothetical protein